MADVALDLTGKELEAWLRQFEEVTDEVVALALRQAGDRLEAKAVELSPVDIGNLQASSTLRFFRRGDREIAELAFTAPYAAEVHELPENARGPRTRAKPGNEFGQAGPKYVERPLRGAQKGMPGMIGRFLQKLWRQRARLR